MQITFDPFNAADMTLISSLLSLSVPAKAAQSEVASNTDTTATEAPLPHSEGSGVTGAVVAGEIPEAKTAPAPVKTRKAKEVVAPVPTPAPTPAPIQEDPPLPLELPLAIAELAQDYTLDDVRAALQAFTASKGMPEGIAVLKSFQAVRVSELKPEQYADFIKACAV
jgi:hypothetical protein